MKNIRFILVYTAALLISTDAFSWGQKGHDVTCCIAQNHLTTRAKKKISAILDGKSIVYWANWMDNASHTKEFAHTATWHYRNVDAGFTFENAPVNENGDVVSAINSQIRALKEGKLSKEETALALKMIVHFIGDIHCPMHMGHKSDRGGNGWQVRWFRNGTNLHSVWDSSLVESAHKWSRNEWVEEIDRVSRKDAAIISKGTPDDWARETLAITSVIYESTPVGSKLSYDYVNEWTPTVEQQLLRGGLRLASVLNSIF